MQSNIKGQSQQNSKHLTHTVNVTVKGTPDQFWKYFEFIKLEDIFTAQGSLPGIKATSHFDEWHTPGKQRTIYFTSGDTAIEQILECTVPFYFKYRVFNSTLPARHFVKYLTGEWRIDGVGLNTHIQWTYTFVHKSLLHKLFLKRFFNKTWIPYMEASMVLTKENYEKSK